MPQAPRNLFKDFSEVAEYTATYTASDYLDILEHLMKKWKVSSRTGESSLQPCGLIGRLSSPVSCGRWLSLCLSARDSPCPCSCLCAVSDLHTCVPDG